MESEENGKVLILPTPIPSRLYDSAFDSDFGFSLGRKHSYNSAYDSDHVASESRPSLKPRITEFTSFNPYFTAPYKRVVQGGSLARFTDEKNNESRILKFHFPESRK